MVKLSYPFITGTVGFLGGIFCKDKYTLKNHEVFAANEVQLPVIGNSVQLTLDDPDNCVLRTMQFGFPSLNAIHHKKSYVLSYDCRNRIPYWVFEHLTSSCMQCNENVNRDSSDFSEDESIHDFFRSTSLDYKGSGYDKGHLAKAENHRHTQEAHKDTFVFSNIAPQVGKGFNRDAWKRLENHVIHFVNQYKNVYVCTGPLFLPKENNDGKKYIKFEVIGPKNVAVPTHFFKVIVGETEDNKFDMEAYVMPNTAIEKSVPLRAFLVPKEVIERAAGFLLFEKLPLSSLRKINGLKPNLKSF